jgi:V8-like Glu-specific endopeptidase
MQRDPHRPMTAPSRTSAQRSGVPAMIAAIAGLALTAAASAQVAEWPSYDVALGWNSGKLIAKGQGEAPVVVWERTVEIPAAAHLRLEFEDVLLSGVLEEGSGAYLRITSLGDGDQQHLNAETIHQWSNYTAWFNGPGVHVELIARPGTGPNRVTIKNAIVRLPIGGQPRSICDGVDLRQLSNDPRVARHSVGCTMWIFNDANSMLGTAGHCGATNAHVAHFNTGLSSSGGTPPPAAAVDQYAVEGASAQGLNTGVGQDWMYFAVHRNSETGLTAYQTQGVRYTIASAAPAVAGQGIRITGHGTTSSPVPTTWNQAQKTHVGPYVTLSGTSLGYRPDTTGGNSGSPVVDETTGLVIGVHTHGGCTSTGGANQGTAIQHAGWQNALANPLGLARSGRGTVAPPIYAAGDMVNNFGTVNFATGNFARISHTAPMMNGLAYDPGEQVFYGVSYKPAPNEHRRLYSINPATGATMLLGNITGTTAVINGLGFDPTGNVLYGIAQANGQLFRINIEGSSIAQATAIGAPGGGTVGGLEYSRYDDALYGLDRSTNPARLVRINTGTGQQTVIGPLGSGIQNVSGLAAADGGELYTIDATSGNTLRINSSTGAATVVGQSGGVFGNAYGMSAVIPPGAPPALRITFPSGLPFLIAPGAGHEVRVNIIPGTQSILAGSARVHFRTGGSQFASLPMANTAGDEYAAVLPAFACGGGVEMYFSAEGDLGGLAVLPRDAPATLFSSTIGVLGEEPRLVTTFDQAWPTGWSATGVWHVTNSCLPPGAACTAGPYAYFGRTGTCNYNLPTGAHSGILSAPAVQLPALPPGGRVTLRFCYALETENTPALDKAELFVNGQTRPEWRIADVRPTPTEPDRYWRDAEFDLSEFAGQSISLSWRFNTINAANNAFRGWHLNNVRVHATQVGCTSAPCYANCDNSTASPILNVDDFTCFINSFAEAQGLPHAQQLNHYANCDGSTAAPVLNVDDFTCFINAFALGCP